jgi:branched-chain amino acid transport system ATP-binding protein
MSAPLLDAVGVSKRYAGIVALSDVSLQVFPAEIAGLIGPNGAGKTTFFDCLYGSQKPDTGRVRFAGRDISSLPEYRRTRLGLGRTFQRIELFPGMTPREHLLVAERARADTGGLWRDLTGRGRSTEAEHHQVERTLRLLGLANDADRPIEALSLGRGRLVELGRALMTNPKLLLLDEPSSGLDRQETAAMVGVLRQVCDERNTAILLVEHDVEMVTSVAPRLFVLDLGRIIASGPTDEVLNDPVVRRAYLGVVA